MSQSLAGRIVTATGVVNGEVHFADKIEHISAGAPANGHWIIPGFVDLHVHGGGGADSMQGAEAMAKICRAHAAHGTTSLLATTVTSSPQDLKNCAIGVQKIMQKPLSDGARVIGLHLEGPYISDKKLGAQPSHSRVMDWQELRNLQALVPIRVVTLAPEIQENFSAIEKLAGEGIAVQLGHSAGKYEDAIAALQIGAKGFTHLFNAMSGFHHREPGVAGAALARAKYAEIIPDLLHVHEGAVLAALRAIPNLYCVTDSTSAMGMPDGDYKLGELQVQKCLGGVRLADGTLAGSCLSMDQAFRNLLKLGLSVVEAVKRCATIPAQYIEQEDCGQIEIGRRADLLVMNANFEITKVVIGGNTL